LERQGEPGAADAYDKVAAVLDVALPGSPYHVEFALRAAAARARGASLPDAALLRALRALGRAHALRFGGGADKLRRRLAGRLPEPLLQAASGLSLFLRQRGSPADTQELLVVLPPEESWQGTELLLGPEGASAHCGGMEAQAAFPKLLQAAGPARYRRREHAVVVRLVEAAGSAGPRGP